MIRGRSQGGWNDDVLDCLNPIVQHISSFRFAIRQTTFYPPMVVRGQTPVFNGKMQSWNGESPIFHVWGWLAFTKGRGEGLKYIIVRSPNS